MRGLKLTLFVLVFVSLTAEFIRHAYVRFVENHQSVLDEYDAVRSEIRKATSLQALQRRYAEELEKEKANKQKQHAVGPEGIPGARFQPQDPESPVFKLRQAITAWEQTENNIRELRFFWGAGLVCLLVAVVCHWRGGHSLSASPQAAGLVGMT